MKKTLTWWVGWGALFPIRIGVMLLVSIAAVIFPTMFYGVWHMKTEDDQDKWQI